MVRLLPVFMLVLLSLRALAQSDSLTISDTIGISRHRGFLQPETGYRYYGAGQLTGDQLYPLLQRSPDSLARHRLAQSRYLNWASAGLLAGGIGLLAGSYATAGRRVGTNTGLLLAGDAAFLANFIPQGMSKRRFIQSIDAHNSFLRNRPADYVLPPVVYAPARQWPLSLADTISRKRVGLTSQYRYRTIRVFPAGQLSRVTASLNDHDVNEGLRYVRTIGAINGLVGSVGRVLLTGYLTSLLLNRRYRRGSSLNDEFLTTGLLCVGAGFVLSHHASRVQQRWITQFNTRLKERFPPVP